MGGRFREARCIRSRQSVSNGVVPLAAVRLRRDLGHGKPECKQAGETRRQHATLGYPTIGIALSTTISSVLMRQRSAMASTPAAVARSKAMP